MEDTKALALHRLLCICSDMSDCQCCCPKQNYTLLSPLKTGLEGYNSAKDYLHSVIVKTPDLIHASINGYGRLNHLEHHQSQRVDRPSLAHHCFHL